MRRAWLAVGAVLWACGGSRTGGAEAVDAGRPDAAPADARPADATLADAVPADSAPTDAVPDAAWVVPPPAPPHEVRTQADPPTPDTRDPDERTTHFRLPAQLPDLDVRAVAVVGDQVWAGTAGGLFRYDPAAEAFVPTDPPVADPVVDIAERPAGGAAAVVTAHAVLIASAAATAVVATSDAELTAVAVRGDEEILVGTHGGVLSLAPDAALAPLDGTDGWDVRDLAAGADAVYAATPGGLRVLGADAVRPGTAFRAVSACPDGALAAAHAGGVLLDGRALDPGPGGLPTDAVTSLACGADWLLVGHEHGASALRRDGAHTDYYVSQRWVMDDHVRSVALAPDGARWLATAAGLSRVDFVPTTLGDKARALQDQLDRRFWRMDGFVAANARTPDPWSEDGLTLGDDDNDGLWTQMMIGGWAMAAAVTGDPTYCAEARRAVATMLLQIDVPCATFHTAGEACGFIARSLVRDDEGALFDAKASESNWHLQAYAGHRYYWKDDTSSDEYAGHFFGYPLYYDLCATPDEKADLSRHVAEVMDYVIDNGFRLIDLDGQKTSFGNWYPEYVSQCAGGIRHCARVDEDCLASCYGGGFLNGALILGHLLATWHMTGEPRFYEAYERLIREYHYDQMIRFAPDLFTLTNPGSENHSDHELMMLAFHTLIRYEPDADRRRQWTEALLGMYGTETDERNPLWGAFVAGLAGTPIDRDAALRTMRELRTDRRDWPLDATHRLDYVRNRADDRHGRPQFTAVPPYDELPPWWWNGNPFAVSDGGDPRAIRGPMAYLLPYWALRYYGLLGADRE